MPSLCQQSFRRLWQSQSTFKSSVALLGHWHLHPTSFDLFMDLVLWRPTWNIESVTKYLYMRQRHPLPSKRLVRLRGDMLSLQFALGCTCTWWQGRVRSSPASDLIWFIYRLATTTELNHTICRKYLYIFFKGNAFSRHSLLSKILSVLSEYTERVVCITIQSSCKPHSISSDMAHHSDTPRVQAPKVLQYRCQAHPAIVYSQVR
jgi:hypothetical protein